MRDIEQFKRQNELVSDAEPTEGTGAGEYPDEVDLRAEDDALIAAELEAAEAQAERERVEQAEDAERSEDEETPSPSRRRGRRGGRRRSPARTGATPLEGTFDHGEDGYGLWLDPAIQDNPVYAEHWAGHRQIAVKVEEDRIVITRAGDDT